MRWHVSYFYLTFSKVRTWEAAPRFNVDKCVSMHFTWSAMKRCSKCPCERLTLILVYSNARVFGLPQTNDDAWLLAFTRITRSASPHLTTQFSAPVFNHLIALHAMKPNPNSMITSIVTAAHFPSHGYGNCGFRSDPVVPTNMFIWWFSVIVLPTCRCAQIFVFAFASVYVRAIVRALLRR